jgi:hypothetical protein
LIADPVFLGDLGDRPLVGLAEDRHHLLFGESGLFHGPLGVPKAPFSQASAGPKIARQVKGLGHLSEMSDAVLGAVASDLGKKAPAWIAVRSVSDLQINEPSKTIQQ